MTYKVRINLLLVFLSLIFACSSKTENPKSSGIQKIYIGMNVSRAESILKRFGAEETMYQILARDTTKEVHFFRLPSKKVIEFLSEPNGNKRKIVSMLISTYKPKSWNNKQDLESYKFFDSFKEIKEYELKKKIREDR